MINNQEQWRSPSLGKDMQITVYGDSGTPIIGLPTRGESCEQWKEYGMVDAISQQLENGYNQLICVSSVDGESILNNKIAPKKRLMRHRQFESYIIEEVVPFIKQRNHVNYLMISGVDLGGYHAINLALKYPRQFDKAIGISGLYDVRDFYDDFYSDDIYYNNPIDFVPNLSKQRLLKEIRDIDFRLVSYANDPRKAHAEKMGQIFRKKFIEHELDIWDLTTKEEWDLWGKMLKTHII